MCLKYGISTLIQNSSQNKNWTSVYMCAHICICVCIHSKDVYGNIIYKSKNMTSTLMSISGAVKSWYIRPVNCHASITKGNYASWNILQHINWMKKNLQNRICDPICIFLINMFKCAKSQERYIPNYDFLFLENRITKLSFRKNNFVAEHFVTQIFFNSYKTSKNISILEKTNYIFYNRPMLFSPPILNFFTYGLCVCGFFFFLASMHGLWDLSSLSKVWTCVPCTRKSLWLSFLRIWQGLFEIFRGLSWIWNSLHAFILQLE